MAKQFSQRYSKHKFETTSIWQTLARRLEYTETLLCSKDSRTASHQPQTKDHPNSNANQQSQISLHKMPYYSNHSNNLHRKIHTTPDIKTQQIQNSGWVCKYSPNKPPKHLPRAVHGTDTRATESFGEKCLSLCKPTRNSRMLPKKCSQQNSHPNHKANL